MDERPGAAGPPSEADSPSMLEPGLTQPLLPAQQQPPDEKDVSIAGEAYSLVSLGWPLVVEEVVTYASTVIAIGMVGRMGAYSLSVFSLARSVTNITGLSPLVGVTGGVDTFVSQTHGAAQHALIGITLQRALLVAVSACIPILALYTQAERLLRALGQEADLAAAAARYIALYSPLLPLHAAILCLYRYLIAQGAVAYVMVAGMVFFAATAPINWLLIFKLGLGLDGSALAAVACDVVYLTTLVAFAVHHNRSKPPSQRPWQGFSWEAFNHLGLYFKVVVPSILMVALDWWLQDIATFLAGLLPNPSVPLAAVSVSYNINVLALMVPFGLGFAICARVGACLGAGRQRAAKVSAEVGFGMGVSAMAAVAVGLLAARSRAARPLTTDPDVLDMVSRIIPPLALAIIANGGTATLAGVLRASGRQKYGAATNGVVNWLFGLPMILFFAFKLKLGAPGLWWGLCAAAWAQVAVMGTLVLRFNWSAETRRAGRLVRRLSQGRNRLEEGVVDAL